jgi:hypothetical protein
MILPQLNLTALFEVKGGSRYLSHSKFFSVRDQACSTGLTLA